MLFLGVMAATSQTSTARAVMSEQALIGAASVSLWGPRQRTALHRAAMVGDTDTVSALTKGGCALDLQDKDGNTALHEASWHGFTSCVKQLVKTGADVNVRNKAGNIALHLASQNSHVPSARLLMLGSSIDSKNNVGETCLHVAARYDNRDIVKILISSQCSLTEKNERGDTALHIAAALNHKKMVQLLLEAGVDANLKNNAGRTALDKARDNNHKDLAVVLARAPQVHRFLRGRTIKKQRERHRSQSACRVEAEPNQTVEQGSSSATEDAPSVEQQEKSKGFKTHKEDISPISNENQKIRKQEEKDKIWVERKAKDPNRKQHLKDGRRQHEFEDSDDLHLQFKDSYQLYTLYRDKDGNVRQSPANGCHCKPLLKRLESELKLTQDEMRLQLRNVQEEVKSTIGQMDRRNRRQIKVVDMINQARAAAERRHLMYRMEQQAAQGREEARVTEAAVRSELKKWCVSELKPRDVPATPRGAPYSRLVHSPSAGQSCGESDLESLPLLSVLSSDSSSSLATYVNIAPSWSSWSLESEQETCRKYFEMKVDRSPDDYENTTPAASASKRPSMQRVEEQDSDCSAVVAVRGEGFGNSSKSSDCPPRWVSPKGHVHEMVKMGHNQDRTIEVYKDRPPTENTFMMERAQLHAAEVSQRFLETVSSQLELWCERKILEVERQTEVQAQKDKQELLQRISTLEAELQSLRTNDSSQSTEHNHSPSLQN